MVEGNVTIEKYKQQQKAIIEGGGASAPAIAKAQQKLSAVEQYEKANTSYRVDYGGRTYESKNKEALINAVQQDISRQQTMMPKSFVEKPIQQSGQLPKFDVTRPLDLSRAKQVLNPSPASGKLSGTTSESTPRPYSSTTIFYFSDAGASNKTLAKENYVAVPELQATVPMSQYVEEIYKPKQFLQQLRQQDWPTRTYVEKSQTKYVTASLTNERGEFVIGDIGSVKGGAIKLMPSDIYIQPKGQTTKSSQEYLYPQGVQPRNLGLVERYKEGATLSPYAIKAGWAFTVGVATTILPTKETYYLPPLVISPVVGLYNLATSPRETIRKGIVGTGQLFNPANDPLRNISKAVGEFTAYNVAYGIASPYINKYVVEPLSSKISYGYKSALGIKLRTSITQGSDEFTYVITRQSNKPLLYSYKSTELLITNARGDIINDVSLVTRGRLFPSETLVTSDIVQTSRGLGVASSFYKIKDNDLGYLGTRVSKYNPVIGTVESRYPIESFSTPKEGGGYGFDKPSQIGRITKTTEYLRLESSSKSGAFVENFLGGIKRETEVGYVYSVRPPTSSDVLSIKELGTGKIGLGNAPTTTYQPISFSLDEGIKYKAGVEFTSVSPKTTQAITIQSGSGFIEKYPITTQKTLISSKVSGFGQTSFDFSLGKVGSSQLGTVLESPTLVGIPKASFASSSKNIFSIGLISKQPIATSYIIPISPTTERVKREVPTIMINVPSSRQRDNFNIVPVNVRQPREDNTIVPVIDVRPSSKVDIGLIPSQRVRQGQEIITIPVTIKPPTGGGGIDTVPIPPIIETPRKPIPPLIIGSSSDLITPKKYYTRKKGRIKTRRTRSIAGVLGLKGLKSLEASGITIRGM